MHPFSRFFIRYAIRKRDFYTNGPPRIRGNDKRLEIFNSFKKLKIKIKTFKTYSIAADKLTNIFVMSSLSGLSTLATLKVLCKKKRADRWVSFNPILHTAWLDNHALTLKSNSAKYYFHEKSRFLYTFLKFCCESRKFKLSSKTFYFECYKCLKKSKS